MTPKEELIANIEAGNVKPEAIDFLLKVINEGLNKKVLMDFVYSDEERKKVDSAYPQDYVNKIRDIYPNWQGWTHAYDYNKNRIWGELIDVGAKALEKLGQNLR